MHSTYEPVLLKKVLYYTARCEDLDPPDFGSVILSGRSVGDRATYSCDPGYILVGDLTRVCEEVIRGTAEWSSEPPICERM